MIKDSGVKVIPCHTYDQLTYTGLSIFHLFYWKYSRFISFQSDVDGQVQNKEVLHNFRGTFIGLPTSFFL